MSKNRLENILTAFPELTTAISSRLLVKTGIIEGYQPIGDTDQSKRESIRRWEAIRKLIDRNASLCIDIGCNTGYFANAVSDLGIFTIGIDLERKNTIVADAQYKRPNLVFKNAEITLENASLLPSSDIVIYMSVFHHLVKYFGQDNAIETLRILAQKCQKQMFFETGQFDETGTKFAPLLEFMADIDAWTKRFFIGECGFSECICLGEFETFLTPIKRKLFLLKRV